MAAPVKRGRLPQHQPDAHHSARKGYRRPPSQSWSFWKVEDRAVIKWSIIFGCLLFPNKHIPASLQYFRGRGAARLSGSSNTHPHARSRCALPPNGSSASYRPSTEFVSLQAQAAALSAKAASRPACCQLLTARIGHVHFVRRRSRL